MDTYFIIKFIHIISSVLILGTGLGSGFYLSFTNRSGSVESIATTSRLVVRADWWFTTPALIVLPVSGLWMIYMAGWPLRTPWVVASLVIYALAGACWLPVPWLQMKMARMAANANENRIELPPQYWQCARLWERLGYPPLGAMVVGYFLMVVKPAIP